MSDSAKPGMLFRYEKHSIILVLSSVMGLKNRDIVLHSSDGPGNISLITYPRGEIKIAMLDASFLFDCCERLA